MRNRIKNGILRLKLFGTSVLRRAKTLCRQYLADRWLSWKLYWHEYRPRFAIGLIVTSGFLLAIIWLVNVIVWPGKTDGPSLNELAPPIFVLLAYFVGFAAKNYLPESADKHRRTPIPMALERTEDPTTRPWRPTNHSFPDIRWSPEIEADRLKALRGFCQEQESPWNRGFLKMFERLLEETGTENYRAISIFGPARFIRIHKVTDIGDLRCRHRVVAHLTNTSVFHSDYIRCLEPLPIRNPDPEHHPDDRVLRKRTLSESCFAPHGDVWVQMFPCIDINTHYTGETEDELVSVAGVFGRIQAELQSANASDDEYLNQNHSKNPLVDTRRDAGKLEKDWSAILNVANDLGSENPFIELLMCENELTDEGEGQLTQWVEEAAFFRESGSKEFLLLHDVHPHNVFCKDNKCVLIYDYSWIGRWPHSWVVALSLHRFVREYVIKNIKKEEREYIEREGEHPQKLKEFCARGACLFLDSYRKSCPQTLLPLPTDFEANLGAYIRCANMDKMLGAFGKGLGMHEEIRMRPRDRLVGEARKFIRLMKESEAFQL